MDEFDYSLPVTSPELPVRDTGIVSTIKEFSDGLTLELTDDEIQRAMRIILPLKARYRNRFASALGDPFFTVEKAMKMVDEMENELVDRMANELQAIATVDVSPLFEGEEMVIEFVGILPSHSAAQYGLDHEKKKWEVEKAKTLNQPFLGADKIG
jgi:hypothetical protein